MTVLENQSPMLTTQQVYAKLTIANGDPVEINGETY